MTTEAKIGIGIVHCQSTPGSTDIGFTLVYKSDNGTWSSIIDDTGAVFRHVKIDYETILRMVHFSKDGDGWYMCSMKPIPGRDEEYRASWVYFPSSLVLFQQDIKKVIEVAESQIRKKEFDSNKLQEVIRPYTLCKEFSPRYNVPSVQHGFAFRDVCGDYNLYDLYGCMYQKDFTQYEWVILMEKSLLTFKGEGIEDISNRKILESYVIKPTSNEFGFIPYHNGAEFKSPVLIMEGETLDIEFKKPGYKTIPKKIRSQADFAISVSECKKYFKKNKFIAYDSKTKKQIVSAQIKPLNATEYNDGLSWLFAEQNLENAKFNVKADGYTAHCHNLDLRNKSLEDIIKIPLDPESHEYIFVLPLDNSVVKDSDTAEVVIHSQFVIKASPFKGFKCSGTPQEGGAHNRLTAVSLGINKGGKGNSGKNVVNKSPNEITGNSGIKPTPENHKGCWLKYKFKSVIIGVGVSIAAFMLIFSLVYVLLHIKSCDDDTTGADARNGEYVDSSEDNWNDAYNYLKEHTSTISKKDIDNFDELYGLYEIINSYRFKDLVCFIDKHNYRDDILKIEVWKRLYDKAKEIGHNKKGVYNDENSDQTITFETYLIKDFSNLENVDDIVVERPDSSQTVLNNVPMEIKVNNHHGEHLNNMSDAYCQTVSDANLKPMENDTLSCVQNEE